MLIWILAALLFAGVAALGYYQGAVRLLISLVGLFFGALLAIPLGPVLRPLLPMMGVTNTIWLHVLPPIIVFLLFLLIFMIVAHFVHRKVQLHFKYRTDDYHFTQWEWVNRRLGAVLGLFMGAFWLFILGWVIYVTGYLTVQVAEGTDSKILSLLTQARKDLHTTGLDRSIAAIDPTSPKYYTAADIIGLVYNNPMLVGRLAQYPGYLSLAEKQEFQDISTDTEYNNMLLSKADFVEIFKHPKTQAVLQNRELVQEVVSEDLSDLRQFLETGKSPKYDNVEILGRWILDPYTTLAQERKKNPNMSAAELIRLRKTVVELMPKVTLVATPENQVSLKAELSAAAQQLLNPPQASQAESGAGGETSGMAPDLAQRYGLRGGGRSGYRPTTPQPQPAQPPAPAFVPPVVSGQGSWAEDDGAYVITLQNENGTSQTFKATAEEDRLTLVTPVFNLIFEKEY